MDTIQSLLIEQYQSVDRVTCISREGKGTTRIRIDFSSQDDVQSILRSGYICIGSIQYPATSYKPLCSIIRCYNCQQYGYTLIKRTKASKCLKCGQLHPYNPDCTNTIQCANCVGLHIAGSPECPNTL